MDDGVKMLGAINQTQTKGRLHRPLRQACLLLQETKDQTRTTNNSAWRQLPFCIFQQYKDANHLKGIHSIQRSILRLLSVHF